MTKTEFLNAKIKAYTPTFSNLIGLKKSNETSKLIDFMTMLHPNQPKEAQGSEGKVNGNNFYHFTIYTNCIIRTDVYKGIKKLYPIN